MGSTGHEAAGREDCSSSTRDEIGGTVSEEVEGEMGDSG